MKHIHFIGICGVGMSALAILWQKKGWRVTGSDAGFYPPVSTHLTQHNIEYYAGWHPEKMGTPDLVVVGNVASSTNPEFLFVQKNALPFLSYPELVAQNLVREKSIVCAGTYGKTSTTALIAYILKNAGFQPAYMFGGLAADLPYAADDLGGDCSVLEGDEYKTSRHDNRAKFFHYRPSHLLLTAVKWDHADIYPTAEAYLAAFRALVEMIPTDGLIVACADNPGVTQVLPHALTRDVILYGKNETANYRYDHVHQTHSALNFAIKHEKETYPIQAPIIGEYQAENICGAFALTHAMGVPAKFIIDSIANFHGLKRRLEKRGLTATGAIVYDDIAHSPAKAQSVLANLRKIYAGKIYAVFEPNTGNREIQATDSYRHAFNDADIIIVPRLTKLKTTASNKYLEGADLQKIIALDQPRCRYIENDDELVQYLQSNTKKDDVVVFLGSHGFRGMIEATLA